MDFLLAVQVCTGINHKNWVTANIFQEEEYQMSDFTGSNAEMVNIVHTSLYMNIVSRSYFLQMHLYANIIIVILEGEW